MSLLLVSSLYAQQHSCCAPSPMTSMKAMAANANFAALHDVPLPFPDPSILTGTTVTFPTADGKTGSGYFVKGEDTTKILFIFHEWWGLNDYIKEQAHTLSQDLGVSAVALDLYDGNVATTREKAIEYVKALTTERGMAIIRGAFAHFGPTKHYATIGWCMGGMWSLMASIAGGPYVVGCVMYYGMPERDPKALAPLQAPVLGIFAKKDQAITPEIVEETQKAFKEAGKKITVHSYDAVHAFANPSNPSHDPKATEDAYKKTLVFLKTQFKKKK